MRIGYACLTVGVLGTNFRSVTLKNATEERLLEIINHNLKSLENIIDYNIENEIKLFRISSDIIPFGSSNVNKLPWWDLFKTELEKIGDKVKASKIRVSMHPGQYTVINSPNDEVVERSIADLNYHTRFLDSLGVNKEHKIILHIGGIYNDKAKSIERFIKNYYRLNENVKARLVIENDDKSFNINDVLEIANELAIPVVYDNLHNEINYYDRTISDREWINIVNKTWKQSDGPQKIHYSEQAINKQTGSHSQTVDVQTFYNFYNSIDREDIDIMLEVKDKNISAIKCINATRKNTHIKYLEHEWSKYKYLILEKSLASYEKIRALLKDKNSYPFFTFYNIIDEAIKLKNDKGNETNAFLHIWGYFKDIATDKEKEKFFSYIKNYNEGFMSKNLVKNYLFKLALQYEQTKIKDSYFFTYEQI